MEKLLITRPNISQKLMRAMLHYLNRTIVRIDKRKATEIKLE